MKCQRCSALSGNDASAQIRSEIINLAVCEECAREARDLGLAWQPLPGPKTADGSAGFAEAA